MITAQRLKELLHYDPATGVFTWVVARGRVRVGDVAGSMTYHGYITIGIDGRLHFTHRLAWLYMNGEWPPEDVDHINRIKNDNRWVNLRSATRQQNMYNTDIRCNNTSGHKGVHWFKRTKKWRAHICVNKKDIHLGYFVKKEDAIEAARNGAIKYAKEFAA